MSCERFECYRIRIVASQYSTTIARYSSGMPRRHHRFSPLSDITPGASIPALAASGHVCMVSTIFEWWTT